MARRTCPPRRRGQVSHEMVLLCALSALGVTASHALFSRDVAASALTTGCNLLGHLGSTLGCPSAGTAELGVDPENVLGTIQTAQSVGEQADEPGAPGDKQFFVQPTSPAGTPYLPVPGAPEVTTLPPASHQASGSGPFGWLQTAGQLANFALRRGGPIGAAVGALGWMSSQVETFQEVSVPNGVADLRVMTSGHASMNVRLRCSHPCDIQTNFLLELRQSEHDPNVYLDQGSGEPILERTDAGWIATLPEARRLNYPLRMERAAEWRPEVREITHANGEPLYVVVFVNDRTGQETRALTTERGNLRDHIDRDGEVFLRIGFEPPTAAIPVDRLVRAFRELVGVCFVAGTPVHTEQGLRPIEDVKSGDLVWARDPETGMESLKTVAGTKVTRGQAVVELVIQGPEGEETFGVTANHLFYVQGREWVPAGELQAGDPLVRLGDVQQTSGKPGAQAGPDEEAALRVVSVSPGEAHVTVYNFEVEDAHTYFVGQHAIWVHNEYGEDDAVPPLSWEVLAPRSATAKAQAEEVSQRIHELMEELRHADPPEQKGLAARIIEVFRSQGLELQVHSQDRLSTVFRLERVAETSPLFPAWSWFQDRGHLLRISSSPYTRDAPIPDHVFRQGDLRGLQVPYRDVLDAIVGQSAPIYQRLAFGAAHLSGTALAPNLSPNRLELVVWRPTTTEEFRFVEVLRLRSGEQFYAEQAKELRAQTAAGILNLQSWSTIRRYEDEAETYARAAGQQSYSFETFLEPLRAATFGTIDVVSPSYFRILSFGPPQSQPVDQNVVTIGLENRVFSIVAEVMVGEHGEYTLVELNAPAQGTKVTAKVYLDGTGLSPELIRDQMLELLTRAQQELEVSSE